MKAYIAALPGWKKAVAKRFDALIEREVADVRRAIKWNVPFYGFEGQGWFVAFAAFSKHVKLMFFRGTSLKPVPRVGEHKHTDDRGLDLREDDDVDETQIASWVRQAAAIPRLGLVGAGWRGGRQPPADGQADESSGRRATLQVEPVEVSFDAPRRHCEVCDASCKVCLGRALLPNQDESCKVVGDAHAQDYGSTKLPSRARHRRIAVSAS